MPMIAWQYVGDDEDVLDFGVVPEGATANMTIGLMVKASFAEPREFWLASAASNSTCDFLKPCGEEDEAPHRLLRRHLG